MQLHQLQPTTPRRTKKRIGRGGKRGKTSGKGHKGQKSRAGNSSRPEMREIIKKLPKLRGHGVNRAQSLGGKKPAVAVVNLAVLDANFAAGGEISPATIVAAGIAGRVRKQLPLVKILGTGEVTKKFTVTGCQISKAAKAKLEAVGGKVV